MKSIKNILILVLLLCLLAAGSYIYFKQVLIPRRHTVESSTVVLEKINKVLKLVTVEGQFSEISKHEEYYGYNISPLRKKTLIRVNAEVLVGYDLEKVEMKIDEQARRIHIDKFPTPEILSLDDDVEYFDISEGLFVSFSKEDYTAIQKKAKKDIEEVALESGLIESAEKQKDELISLIDLTLNNIGWELVIKEKQIKD